jgi:hypothetical protein
LHTADIGAVSVTTQNGEDFTVTLTRNDGSTLTAAWSGIKWRSYEPDIHTDWTNPLNPVLMLNDQVKQDVQRSLNNVEIEQTLDLNTSLLTTTLTLHPNLGTPVTRTKVVDLTELQIRWGNLFGAVQDQTDLVDYITLRLLPHELLANKVTGLNNVSNDDEYPSARAVWDHAVPRADVATLLTELNSQLVSAHELAFTKSWYDTPNRASDSETKSLTSDPHLLFSKTSPGYEIAVDMQSLVSQSLPNWLMTDPDDGNLRVDVTYDLSLKEDKANKADSIDDTNRDAEVQYPSNKAVTEWADARYIHGSAGTAPANPQTIGTALRVAGKLFLNKNGFDVKTAESVNGNDLALGDSAVELSFEGSADRPGYNADTLALMSDVDLKQDKQTFIDNPETIDSPVFSVPDTETIRLEWQETNRTNGNGGVTARAQDIKTDETLRVSGAGAPTIGVVFEKLISQDTDNEIGLGGDGKLFNLNSINKPLSPGYYLPIIHFDGARLTFSWFQTPAVDGTYQVQCIVTNGIPAWAVQ